MKYDTIKNNFESRENVIIKICLCDLYCYLCKMIGSLVNEINSQLNRKYKVNSKDDFNLIINHDSIGYGLESEIDNKANIIAYNKTHKAKVDSDLSVFYNVNNKNIRFISKSFLDKHFLIVFEYIIDIIRESIWLHP